MDRDLVGVLGRARELGFLGPGPVEGHIEHAGAFVEGLREVAGLVVDLGSGGGVPGLVVGVARPDLRLVLVDAMGKRCRYLEWAVDTLGLDAQVVEGRAESVGRDDLRGAADAVTARSFGPPATTAECAAPLLRPGGLLLVSEPPDGDDDRWPSPGLTELGLAPGPRVVATSTVQTLVQAAPCPDRFPRRDGVPAKRPLF